MNEHCKYCWQPTDGLTINEVLECSQGFTVVDTVPISDSCAGAGLQRLLLLDHAELADLITEGVWPALG